MAYTTIRGKLVKVGKQPWGQRFTPTQLAELRHAVAQQLADGRRDAATLADAKRLGVPVPAPGTSAP